MGKFLISLGVLVLTGMCAGSLVYGASTGSVAVTVQAQSISVAVTDGAVAYGSVALSATANTTTNGTHDSQTATNDGNQAETFNIKGQDASSTGTAWTLSNTAIGTNTYMHEVCTSTCDATPTWRKTASGSYITLDNNKAQGGTSLFDLQISLPSSSTDVYSHAANLTVQAVSYP